MTRKRDLKRRVRERQAQTGENYTTARHRVVSARTSPPPDPVPVIDLHDVSSVASSLGFLCRVAMFPSLAERVEPASTLASLRETLVKAACVPSTAHLCSVAFGPQCPPPVRAREEAAARLFERARAGHAGASADGALLAFHVLGSDGSVPVLCARWRDGRAIVLMVLDAEGEELWRRLVAHGAAPDPGGAGTHELRHRGFPYAWLTPELPYKGQGPVVFVIYEGRRHPVVKDKFIIGRGSATSDLAIKDGNISRKHAAVIRRNGTFYIKDLGSTNGIDFKGMRIDNKRIDEGDVFHLCDHALRFTYRSDGE